MEHTVLLLTRIPNLIRFIPFQNGSLPSLFDPAAMDQQQHQSSDANGGSDTPAVNEANDDDNASDISDMSDLSGADWKPEAGETKK